MIKNYFKIAWRTMSRHKVYTFINVLGLAVGISACIVIFLITNFELGFDRFHPDGDRVYRIVGEAQQHSGEKIFLNSPIPEVAGFETAIPGFEAKAGVYLYGGRIQVKDGKGHEKEFNSRIENSYSSTMILTSPQYFDIFKYEWLAGNAASLNTPFRVVLSEARGKMYFGDISPDKMIGKEVIYYDSLPVYVAGIVKDWRGNTDFGFTDIISVSTGPRSFLRDMIPADDWSSLSPHRSMAFVKLSKGTTAAQINSRFDEYLKKSGGKIPRQATNVSMMLQPLKDIHFTSDFHRGDDGDDFRKPYLPTLYAMMGLALFILLIAVFNFINLSTAQSMQRSKEVGVRKIMGSNKSNIAWQFLTETFFLTLLAVVVSVLLVSPILSIFSDFIPAGVSFHVFRFSNLVFLLVILSATTLLAGFYPARVLASYLPVLNLKNLSSSGSGRSVNVRKALIVFQFSISLLFIIGALVIGGQIRFMRNIDKGFNSDAIVIINKWRDEGKTLPVLAEAVKRVPGVAKVIVQSNAPMGFAHGGESFVYRAPEEIKLGVSFDAANEDFVPFYRMKIIAGRNILHSDSLKELLINETCYKAMGLSKPGDAVGKLLYRNDKPYLVVGVVANFLEGSFHDQMRPVVIGKMPEREGSLAIKLTNAEDGNAAKVFPLLEKAWKNVYPNEGFNCNFLNDGISRLYDQETKTAWLVKAAMFVTIFISCMGLFGLAMFTAEKKTKEIGIRKVLGASVTDIASMLSKEFVLLVLIASVIASPVAWYFSRQWLDDFVYRIDVGWWMFVVAAGVAVVIALITVSSQAIKAALMNPAKSLRTE